MKRNSKKQRKGAFHQNLSSITLKQIESMQVLDSEEHFRLLKDAKSKMYFVFNGVINQTYYSTSRKEAQQFFNQLINTSN